MTAFNAHDIPLAPEAEKLLRECLSSGNYADAGDALAAGLRLLKAGLESAEPDHAWPIGGGECGRLIRELDWRRTALGPVERWSPTLRTTASNIVNSPVPKVLMWGPDHVMLYNDGYRMIAGDYHPRALGGTVPAIWPEIWSFNQQVLERGLRGEVLSYRDQAMTLNRFGTPELVVFDLFYTPIYEPDGSVGGVMCTVLEITDRINAERALAESESELRQVTGALPLLVACVDRDHVYRFANRFYEDWFGVPASAMIGRTIRQVTGDAYYEGRLSLINKAFAGESLRFETVIPHQDGQNRRAEVRYIPRIDADGQVSSVYMVAVDVEERARREEALALSNQRFRAAMDAVHGVLWTNGSDGRMTGEQPGWAALTGQAQVDYEGHGWANAVHPDDREASVATWNEAVAAKRMYVFEHRVRRHDGAWRNFAIRALPILDADGAIMEWVGVHTDITHQRMAEESLREQAERLVRQVQHRERAEAQLRELNETLENRIISAIDERRQAEAKLVQAQKMETIGKLTGGVAHDFNNLLQVVSGNLQLLLKDVAGNERAERRVSNALAGTSRGSKLAAQLLAFGRRQALEPKVVNITRFVQGMDHMLRRAIGESIEVETVVGGGLWNTFIDPTQVENAILNLAINARDAMNGTGKLTIELSNAHLDEDYARRQEEVSPGQYVLLAVTDTGCGMTPDIIERVYEPFFSTKPEGKGTGLGLSMVYGFVKQSGGHVKIYSEVGHGTTVKLYLPRALRSEDEEVVVDMGPVTGGTETVLVVEDDAEVRDIVVDMLADLGYRVLRAVDASNALVVIESGIPIDLLFTDVVMPGTLKSPELARKARERLPNLAVLFTSGYTQNAIVHGGRLDAGVELLSKPYSRETLARKVRHVLRNQAQRQSASSAPHLARTSGPGDALRDGGLGVTVLLVEDDELIRLTTAELLEEMGCRSISAGDGAAAMAILCDQAIDCLVTDINLPGISGLRLAEQARSLDPALGVVFASGDLLSAAETNIPGAVCLAKPYRPLDLANAVRAALGHASDLQNRMVAID